MSRRLRSVASRSQTMLMGPGQCRSAHDGELCGRARRNRRAFMEVEACGLAADFDEITMDAKDIAAHADECHLGSGYPVDGRMAFCRRNTGKDRKSTRLNSSH